jgi:rare lipoprotein A
LARYTGRHHRQAQHGSWFNRERSRRNYSRQVLPTATAALAVAAVLFGGGSLVIKFGTPNPVSGIDSAYGYDAADYPPADRDAQQGRPSRDQARQADTPPASAAQTGPVATTPPITPTQQPRTNNIVANQPLGNADVISSGTCKASYYDEGQQTASGEMFDPNDLTAASKTLPFNTMVRVTNVSNGKSVVVRVNDRGPFVSGRCLDLSSAAFGTIAKLSAGVASVKYEVLGPNAS